MKKRTLQISMIAVCLLAAAPVSEIFRASRARAQGAQRIANTSDVWYAGFTITIAGSGTEDPPLGSGGPQRFWRIDRLYTGNFRLASGTRVGNTQWSDKEREESIWAERKINFTDPAPRLRVKINDYVLTKYDPQCEEYTTEMETWEADVKEGPAPRNKPSLMIDNKTLMHSVSFPTGYAPKVPASELKYQKDTNHHPKGPLTLGKPEYRSLKSYRLPVVKDWLEKDGTISREVPFVKTKEGDYLFDSGELPVAESLLERVNTGGKVTIRIVYTIHKDPN